MGDITSLVTKIAVRWGETAATAFLAAHDAQCRDCGDQEVCWLFNAIKGGDHRCAARSEDFDETVHQHCELANEVGREITAILAGSGKQVQVLADLAWCFEKDGEAAKVKPGV